MGRHGLRVAEVAALTVDSPYLEDPQMIRVIGKGQKTRKVYLTSPTVEALREWLKVRSVNGTAALFVALDNGHRGSPMTTVGLRYVVNSYLTKLGLKADGISCHSPRHSEATWARFGGARLDAISHMLGHSSIETTRILVTIVNLMSENPAAYLEKALEQVQ
jgi:site-specific recombinase XerD